MTTPTRPGNSSWPRSGPPKAALQTANINLAYTRITAPISGRIGKSAVTEGALVTAQQADSLTSISQLDPMYVDVRQSTADLLRLKRLVAEGKLTQGRRTGPVSASSWKMAASMARKEPPVLRRDRGRGDRHGDPCG